MNPHSEFVAEATPVDQPHNGETQALLRILELEADIRRVSSEQELVYHMANESRSVLGFRQAFVLRRVRRWQLQAVSSVANFDAQAPLNRQVVRFVISLQTEDSPNTARLADLSDASEQDALRNHAFQHAVWMPLVDTQGRTFAGMLLMHEKPWPESFLPLAQRLGEAYAHAWRALAGQRISRRWPLSGRMTGIALLSMLAVAGFIRAPLSVLAPVEVTGQERVAVAASIDGVIEEVMVAPNQVVNTGTLLARFDDTELRNALAIAEQHRVVVAARLDQIESASFADRSAARDLKVAAAELTLAETEIALARERLSRIDIIAPQPGIAVFDDARDLTGRPVRLGERIMEITNPDKPEFTIRMPVTDSIVLHDEAPVRVFLDSDPLHPLDAVLLRSSYHATMGADGSFAYTLVAQAAQALPPIRIGAQGTAQVFGDHHSLYFHVFRRPLSWIRQRFGV